MEATRFEPLLHPRSREHTCAPIGTREFLIGKVDVKYSLVGIGTGVNRKGQDFQGYCFGYFDTWQIYSHLSVRTLVYFSLAFRRKSEPN